MAIVTVNSPALQRFINSIYQRFIIIDKYTAFLALVGLMKFKPMPNFRRRCFKHGTLTFREMGNLEFDGFKRHMMSFENVASGLLVMVPEIIGGASFALLGTEDHAEAMINMARSWRLSNRARGDRRGPPPLRFRPGPIVDKPAAAGYHQNHGRISWIAPA